MKLSLAKLLFSLVVLSLALSSPAEASCMTTCVSSCGCAPDDQVCGQFCHESCVCQCLPQYCN